MNLPKIVFSKWKHWSERTTHDSISQPGVYILAHFEKLPKRRANPHCQEVLYIGETCGNSLKGRWREFDRSAFQAKFGHSGGATYYRIFHDDGSRLYVSSLPLGKVPPPLQPLFIRYVERKLILEYALKWGRPPACNSK